VRNSEINYQAIDFYLKNQPMQLTRLLQVVTPNIEPGRVVHQMRKTDNLPLIFAYLKDVQKENLTAVNEAVNELLVDEEDFEALRESIDEFDNFDQIALAQKVEEHELLEFRRIAAYLFKKNQRWEQSVELSKRNKMYKDAIDTSNDSNDPDIVESLLRFFVEKSDKECFCATLYTCYDLVRPDVALELAWRNKYEDFAMPYLIQFMRHLTEKVDAIDERTKAPEVEQTEVPQEMNMAYNGPMQIGAWRECLPRRLCS
jgi:clathrin heavy chain